MWGELVASLPELLAPVVSPGLMDMETALHLIVKSSQAQL